jgi:hypothetical protein
MCAVVQRRAQGWPQSAMSTIIVPIGTMIFTMPPLS